ncbi:MAG TPA: anti-sigma factor [Terriglobales bacterium]|nr:anti-sigma factor [Terriglobales bacterium]
MQCKDVELVLEQDGLLPVPEAARAHIAACAACRDLVADLSGIVSAAHTLPAEIDPPARVWLALRAQLEAEGVIKNPSLVLEHGSGWRSFARFFRGRALATAAVGLLIAAGAVLQLYPTKSLTEVQVKPQAPDPYAQTALTLDQEERDLDNMQLAGTSVVDTSMRQNLGTLDDFIRDCRRHLQENPQDELAREYLSGAYRQKAELLSAMMERGGSVN